MAGKKVNRLIVPNIYSVNGVEPVTSVNGILPVNGEVTIPIPTVPTNISAFVNDAGYLTAATLDGYATQTWVRQQGYLTSVPSQYITDTELSTTLADYVTSSSLSTILNSYATASDLSTETSNRMDADDSLQLQINDKYDASNPNGFISGISNTDVITALGYTPYNSNNPNGYITSAALSNYVTNTDLSTTLADYAQITDIPTVGNGTITINQGGVQKGTFTTNQNGNTTINLDAGSGTVDQTYDGTSTNAQSGVAIAGAGFLQNTKASGAGSLTILGTPTTNAGSVNIGYGSVAGGSGCVCIGYNAATSGQNGASNVIVGGDASAINSASSVVIGHEAKSYTSNSIALGRKAEVSAGASSAIQIGYGANSTANSLSIGFFNNSTTHYNWQLLDGTTGLIPDARISTNIARTSQLPTIPTNISSFTNDSGYITGITSSDVTTALGYTPYNSSNPNGYTSNTGTVTSVNNVAPVNGNVTLSIPTVPTNVSAFTNDSGYITGITSSDVTTALGYTPYNSSNPNNYTSNTGTVTSVNNSQPDANGNVTLSIPTVPTNVSAFTNDSGYQTSGDVNTIVTNAISTLLSNIYPIGSVYIGTQAICPLATLISGSTWELVAADRVLQGSSANHAANTTVAAGLPNITGTASGSRDANSTKTGAFSSSSFATSSYVGHPAASGYQYYLYKFDASDSNTIYGNATTVQPPAYVVNIWRRTA